MLGVGSGLYPNRIIKMSGWFKTDQTRINNGSVIDPNRFTLRPAKEPQEAIFESHTRPHSQTTSCKRTFAFSFMNSEQYMEPSRDAVLMMASTSPIKSVKSQCCPAARERDDDDSQIFNLDHLTETFNMSFFMTYLARWPDYFHVAEGPVMGKVEGQGESWHGHVTAVTVSPEYRWHDKAYFVDPFVRASNTLVIKMYEKLGYVIYRRVLRYYSGEEDGLDMRKALFRDVEKKSTIPLKTASDT
ncbi:hypothetical protein LWI29_023211 [Acer saccharum]|uniref:N-acetyltransferase domain-containing protein n=1 Tax=Acer saccharum TaxID=4024 RepID=A0AA39VIY4_ACESA|nr:hypothetical protein LWI29_023211 [Acer saccharum]